MMLNDDTILSCIVDYRFDDKAFVFGTIAVALASVFRDDRL